jgi:hypothetical protein
MFHKEETYRCPNPNPGPSSPYHSRTPTTPSWLPQRVIKSYKFKYILPSGVIEYFTFLWLNRNLQDTCEFKVLQRRRLELEFPSTPRYLSVRSCVDLYWCCHGLILQLLLGFIRIYKRLQREESKSRREVNGQDEVKEENSIKHGRHILCSITIFHIRAVHEIMWKNPVEQGRPQIKTGRMRNACWTTKATHLHNM